MRFSPKYGWSYALQATVIKALLSGLRVFKLDKRVHIIGFLTGHLVRHAPPLRKRAHNNLALALPEHNTPETIQEIGRNTGGTLAEILYNEEFSKTAALTEITGQGFEVLKNCRETGQGAIILSGHFGHWEVIRHVLKAHGMETGALYRPNNNPYYDPLFVEGISHGGTPLIPKGKAGFRIMLSHLKKGGFIALLPDQYAQDGHELSFMGQPVKTPLAAADLALKYKVPLVPCFAPRGANIVTFEEPIPHSNAQEMMQIYNDRLEAWVRRYPTQWHWLHQRFR